MADEKQKIESGNDAIGQSVPSATGMNADSPLHSAQLLIIEDDVFILDLLRDKLERAAGKVMVAYDADQALKVLLSERVDIILLDILLPKKDGFTFLRELKADQRFKKIPVIILSNLGQKEEQERGMGLGAVDYIIKANSSPTEIIARVSRVMAEQKKLHQ